MQAICKGEQLLLDRRPEIDEAAVRAKFVDQRVDKDELAATSSQRTRRGVVRSSLCKKFLSRITSLLADIRSSSGIQSGARSVRSSRSIATPVRPPLKSWFKSVLVHESQCRPSDYERSFTDWRAGKMTYQRSAVEVARGINQTVLSVEPPLLNLLCKDVDVRFAREFNELHAT